MITRQEFFDKTVQHLIDQGKRCVDDYGLCLYRKENGEGLKCAAGIHIPDELYRKEMETENIIKVLADYPELKDFFPDRNLAIALQRIHDAPSNWEYYGGKFIHFDYLETVARQYGLEWKFTEYTNK